MEQYRGTTIISVRRDNSVSLGGDGQVTLGNVVIKSTARKIRRLYHNQVIAGFAGGVVAALVASGPRPNLWGIISSVIVGALAGGYLGPIAPQWFPHWMGTKPSPGVSFGIGVAGLPLCKGIIAAAQRLKWSSQNGSGRNG